MPRRRNLILAITGLVACVVCSGAVYALIGNPFDPFDNRSFSPAAWRAGSEESKARMARSAVRQIKVGLPASQVVTLLGSPDETRKVEDAGGHKLPGAQTYSYDLGQWSGYGFDDAFLYVHFDSEDRVIGAEINGY